MTVVLTILSGRDAGKFREITRGGRFSIGRSETSLFQIVVDAFLGAFSNGTIQNLTTTENPRKSKYAGTRGIWSMFESEADSEGDQGA